MVEYITPLLALNGFKKDALMMFYIRHYKERGFEWKVLTYIVDPDSLDEIHLQEILPENITIGKFGSGALSYYDYEMLRDIQRERYLRYALVPNLARIIIEKVLNAQKIKDITLKFASTIYKTFLVDLGGEKHVVYYYLSPTPIRENIVANGLVYLKKLISKAKVSRGILLPIYVERVIIANTRIYTPRFFWYLLIYDKDTEHMGSLAA